VEYFRKTKEEILYVQEKEAIPSKLS
jgi:hypothetical protein